MQHKTIRFVTTNYHQLQGLRLVPIGALLVLFSLLALLGLHDGTDVPPHARARFLTSIGLAWWLALGLALAAPAYYGWRYGAVDALDRRWRNRWITAAAIGCFGLARIDRDLQWPVALSVLLVAVSLFITVWHDGRIRRHYLLPAVAWLAASALPVLQLSPNDMQATVWGLAGLTLIACGIGDHLLLARTLASPRTSDHDPHPSIV